MHAKYINRKGPTTTSLPLQSRYINDVTSKNFRVNFVYFEKTLKKLCLFC